MRATTHNLMLLLLTTSGIWPGAMASAADGPANTRIAAHQTVPQSHTQLEHVIAWVPRHHARTAGVAQAMTHLALDKATRAAEADLCQGTWTLSAPVQQRVQPRAVQAPPELGGEAAWYYRLSRARNAMQDCRGVSSLAFQQALSRHLPHWILLRPAQQLSLLQNGKTLLPGVLADLGDASTLAYHQAPHQP